MPRGWSIAAPVAGPPSPSCPSTPLPATVAIVAGAWAVCAVADRPGTSANTTAAAAISQPLIACAPSARGGRRTGRCGGSPLSRSRLRRRRRGTPARCEAEGRAGQGDPQARHAWPFSRPDRAASSATGAPGTAGEGSSRRPRLASRSTRASSATAAARSCVAYSRTPVAATASKDSSSNGRCSIGPSTRRSASCGSRRLAAATIPGERSTPLTRQPRLSSTAHRRPVPMPTSSTSPRGSPSSSAATSSRRRSRRPAALDSSYRRS